jgi:hypothetical protein
MLVPLYTRPVSPTHHSETLCLARSASIAHQWPVSITQWTHPISILADD